MWVTSGGGWCYIAFFEVLADPWIFHVSMESKGGRQGAVVTMGGEFQIRIASILNS